TPLTRANALRLIRAYVDHYNTVRLHSAIGYVTPQDMLAGRQAEIHAARDRKLEEARRQRQLRRRQAAPSMFARLGERTKARAIEEMKHAEGLIVRIISLDGIPSVGVGLKPRLGENVQQQMEINLEDEQNAVRQYNEAV